MSTSTLFSDLTDLLRDPGMLWQLGAIALCVLLGWSIAHALRSVLGARQVQPSVARFGVDTFARIVSPLLMVLLLALVKALLAKWYATPLLRLALVLFGSLALIRFGFYLLRRVFARHGQVGAALHAFEKIFALMVWLVVAAYLTGILPDLHAWLDATTLPLGPKSVSLAAILQALVSVVLLLMLAMWAGAALEERLMHMQGLHTSLRVVMARMGRALLILVAVLASLSLVGIDLTVLSVFGGALGVGLGLGLQKIASNYVSGIVILLDRSLSIGDVIGVDKYFGKVTQINARYTVLESLDGIESVLPNEMLVSGAMQNYSLSSRIVRVATHLTVSYDSDLTTLMPRLEQCAAGVTRVLADPAPAASLMKFGPDGIELELGCWIGDPENGRGGVISDVNKAIWRLVRDEQIRLPFSTRDTRFLDARIAAVMAGAARPSPP